MMNSEQETQSKRKVKWPKYITIEFVMSFLAIGLSLLTFFNERANRRDDEKFQSLSNRLAYRPRLEVVEPRIGAFDINDSIVVEFDSIIGDSIYDVYRSIIITLDFSLVNKGDHIAHVVHESYSDTIGEEMVLKKRLINNSSPGGFNEIVTSEHPESVGSGEAAGPRKITWKIGSFSNENTFTLHGLIIYGNEAQELFETYYWQTFKLHNIKIVGNRHKHNTTVDSISFSKPYNYSAPYDSREEATVMIQAIQDLKFNSDTIK